MSDTIEKPVTVRTGTPEDLDGMMQWAQAAAQDNAISVPDADTLLKIFWGALNCENGIVGIIGENGKSFEAAVLLTVGNLWYSSEPVLEEKVIFVLPEYRASKYRRASLLCEFSKKAADELKMPLAIGVLSNNRTRSKIKFYERAFGSPAGVFFLYGRKTGLDENQQYKSEPEMRWRDILDDTKKYINWLQKTTSENMNDEDKKKNQKKFDSIRISAKHKLDELRDILKSESSKDDER